MTHGASCLTYGVIQSDAAFFGSNENCMCSQRFAHRCNPLATLNVAMGECSVTRDYNYGRLFDRPGICALPRRIK
jgi:hypothetical protein